MLKECRTRARKIAAVLSTATSSSAGSVTGTLAEAGSGSGVARASRLLKNIALIDGRPRSGSVQGRDVLTVTGNRRTESHDATLLRASVGRADWLPQLCP